MKHETITVPPSERKVDVATIERAREMLAAGIGVEHTVVSAWLRTWGTADRRSFHEWLADWNG